MGLDAIVIGAGHNGLATAAYLARAGLRTRVLERRPVVGGACVTEALWPGFRVSRGAYVASLVRPALIRELKLARHGLRFLPRNPSSYTPIPNDPGLLLGSDQDAACREIGRYSTGDAARYPEYESLLSGLAAALEPLLDVPPPDPSKPRWRDLPPLLKAGARLLALRRRLPRGASLLLGAARPVLESWFESEPLLATLATDAVIGAWAAPSTPGTGYVLFHHVMGEIDGTRGVWAYVQGGMGRLSEALADAARGAGAEIVLERSVERILVREGRAQGVVLQDGDVLEAPIVVSNADPRRTFVEFLDANELPEDFLRDVHSLDFRSPVVKINLALDGLPSFPGRGSATPGPEHVGTIHVGATTLDDLEASFAAACAGELPKRPMIELTIPSTLDESLAPPGRYVASMFVQHVPWSPKEGWNAARGAFADRVFALVDEVAPGFSSRVLHSEVLAPPDLEELFGLTGGNIFHGAMTLERLLFLRPVPGWSHYGTPIPGLYLCGAGTHPGGGVMGACGRNAAGRILAERRG